MTKTLESPQITTRSKLKIEATDGFVLSATFFSSRLFTDKVVLVGSATAVHQRYYEAFATYLAERGLHVYTFDYRGVGESMPSTLKGFKAKMQDWGKLDLDAMIRYIKKQYPTEQLVYIGHSVGGQVLALTPESKSFSKIIMVAAQIGYWKLWPGYQRYIYAMLLYTLWPWATRICGYFPGKALKIFWDLPKGVALEWAKWCKSSGGIFSHHPRAYAKEITAPVFCISVEDDKFAPFSSVVSLLSQFSSSYTIHSHYSLVELGVKKAGHFSFFRKKFQAPIWEQIAEWLSRPS